MAIVEINTDLPDWDIVRHALREAGYKVFLQPNLFDETHLNLFLERRAEDPEGRMSHGFILHDGGNHTTVCQLCGHKMDGLSAAEGSQSFGKDGKTCTCGCHR